MARAFISHSTVDRDLVANGIVKPLNDRHIDTFYCSVDLRPGDYWERVLVSALNDCDWFVIVMSHQSAKSEWVRDEVHWAVGHRPDRIIPLKVDDCDPASLHLRLGRLQYIDFRNDRDKAVEELATWLRGPPRAARATANPAPAPRKTPSPSPAAARRYVIPQQEALSKWRLFGFHRQIVLSDIYVEEVLEQTQSGGGIFGSIARGPPVPEKKVYDNLLGHDEHKRRIWVILGDAGSGKSTLLRHWTIAMLEAHSADGPRGARKRLPPIPIFLSLRLLSQQLRHAGKDALDASILAATLQATIPGLDRASAMLPFDRLGTLRDAESSWFTRLRGKRMDQRAQDPPEWLFLLDGLDEMDPQTRPALLHWLKRLPRGVRAVVASRPGIVAELGGLDNSICYRVCDFNGDQINRFVNQWFSQAPALGGQLLAAIHEHEKLAAVASVPLLLTCLSMDVEVRGRCDYSESFIRGTVYRRMLGILMHEWDEAKAEHGGDPRLIEVGMQTLSELAGRNEFDTPIRFHELWSESHRAAEELGLDRDVVEQFIRRVTESGRLLVRDAAYGFLFAHKAFYDFFWSEAVRSRTAAAMSGAPRGHIA